jgi:hypothetical protein
MRSPPSPPFPRAPARQRRSRFAPMARPAPPARPIHEYSLVACLGPRPHPFLCGVPSEHTDSLGCGSQGWHPGLVCDAPLGQIGQWRFQYCGSHHVSDTEPRSRFRFRMSTAFPSPCVHRGFGIGPLRRFQSHAAHRSIASHGVARARWDRSPPRFRTYPTNASFIAAVP